MADATQHHCTRAWYLRPPVWIFSVLLLGLAAFGVVEIINRPATIPYGDFFDQLSAGNVASVTFQGMQVNGHFKHAIAAPAAKGTAPQDVFRSQVPDISDPALLPELRKEHVLIDVVSSSNWLSWLGRLPWPMVLFIAFIVIAGIFKLKRGGTEGALSGSAMPMQHMSGMIAGLFGKQSPAGTSTQEPVSDQSALPPGAPVRLGIVCARLASDFVVRPAHLSLVPVAALGL